MLFNFKTKYAIISCSKVKKNCLKGGNMKNYYPFSAIVGQNEMKLALILSIINPKIKGVLIFGEKGTGKSSAVRSISQLLGKEIVNLPLNVSEDMLVGTIDLEKTVFAGKPVLEYGIFKKAHNNILYIDEVNLLKDSITDIILQVNSGDENLIEREGISEKHDSKFMLVGTMNEEEGFLRGEFLDRFGIAVRVCGEKDEENRFKILKRNDEYENNFKTFIESYKFEENRLLEKINHASKILNKVIIDDDLYKKIVELSLENNVEGHRADLIMVETLKALAAFDGRNYIRNEDIEIAEKLVYLHRKRMFQKPQQNEKQSEKNKEDENDLNDNKPQKNNKNNGNNKQREKEENKFDKEKQKGNERPEIIENSSKIQIFSANKTFRVKKFGILKNRKVRGGEGKRTIIKTNKKSGRYVFNTMNRTNDDLAFDATIRAASIHQKNRDKKGKAIAIKEEDIREKVREKKVSDLLMFVVDSSGSMAAKKRMEETKAAVLSLLEDAYVKRDKISLVVFNGNKSRVVLPPTSAVKRGYDLLKNLETGGRTPLNDALIKASKIIKAQKRKSKEILPYLIVITDGKGNVPVTKNENPREELMRIGEGIKNNLKVQSMVIDIEKDGLMKIGTAKDFADVLGAKYCKIDDLKKDKILEAVKALEN